MINIRNIAFAFGGTFILVAGLGFIPNPLVSPNGLFAVNAMHNIVHLLTGMSFIAGTLMWPHQVNRVVQVIGAAYFAVAILGFFTSGNMLLGIVHINEADRWLHLGLAIAILGAGFLFKPAEELPTRAHG